MQPATWVQFRKLKADTAGSYLLSPDPTQAQAFTLAGIPVMTSTLVPADRIILIDSRQIVVASDVDAGGVAFLRERYADFDQVGIKLVQRFDIGALWAQGIVDWTIGTG